MTAAPALSLLELAYGHLKALAELRVWALLTSPRHHRRCESEGVELMTIRREPTELSILHAPGGADEEPGANHTKLATSPFSNELALGTPETLALGVGIDPGGGGDDGTEAEGSSGEEYGEEQCPVSTPCGVHTQSPFRKGADTIGVPKFDPEQVYFSNLVNNRLKGDPALDAVLPLNPESDEILGASRDGVLPCKLLGTLLPDAIDGRAVNIAHKGVELSEQEILENHALCLSSVKALGGSVEDLSPSELMSANRHAVMALLWLIIRAGALQSVNVRKIPELGVLQKEDENLPDLLQLSAEELLLRWVNFALEQVEILAKEKASLPHVTDFNSAGLKDCLVYAWLLHRAAPDLCDPAALKEKDTFQRAEAVLETCEKLGIGVSHTPQDLSSGNQHVGMALIAELFEASHGLVGEEEEIDSKMDEEDQKDEGTREERMFTMWMNSLGCSTYCNDLFAEDLRQGWLLLEVLDSMVPGSVDWARAFQPPFKQVVSRIKSVENCNQVVQIAKQHLNLSLVGIGGEDIADGKQKPILSLVWQMMHCHTLQVLQSVALNSAHESGSAEKDISEADVLAWGNQLLSLKGSKWQISSFRDPNLASGLPLLDLLRAIEPRCVQDRFIAQGFTYEEQRMNANYVISTTRKLGGTVLVAWEDIVEVRPKMILILLASLMQLDKQRRQIHRAAALHRKSGLSLEELKTIITNVKQEQ